MPSGLPIIVFLVLTNGMIIVIIIVVIKEGSLVSRLTSWIPSGYAV